MSGLRLSVLWHCQQGETLSGSVLLNYQSSTSIASLVWLGESCLHTFGGFCQASRHVRRKTCQDAEQATMA